MLQILKQVIITKQYDMVYTQTAGSKYQNRKM